MQVDRPPVIKLDSQELKLPIFFPSVSSVKTAMPPVEYVQLLKALRAVKNQFLISAFDLARTCQEDCDSVEQLLAEAVASGMIVLMDSGNYESFWKQPTPPWAHCDFHNALRRFPCSVALGFDEQFPPDIQSAHLNLLMENWVQDQSAAGRRTIIPIIHESPEALPSLCLEFAKLSNVPMVAVPERRLGDGIFQRATSVLAIRRSLNETNDYVGLHLLGTGNPISIAIYSIAGADSFDGLEWCQTVVDYETAQLFHFSHGDFFRQQSSWGEEDLSFQPLMLAHNLGFYSNWMTLLRAAIHDNEAVQFCRVNFPERIYSHCAVALDWMASR